MKRAAEDINESTLVSLLRGALEANPTFIAVRGP